MNIKEQSITVCLLLASLLLSSCGLSQSFGPTVTATSITTATLIPIPSTLTPNPTLASTNTPIPPTPTKAIYLPFPSEVDTSGKIDTSIGTIVVTKAEIVPKDISGNQPAAGHQILQIWFEGAAPTGFFDALEGVYLVGDDGSQTPRYSGGGVNAKLLATFAPPITAKKFWLYWPKNLPIELNITK